MKKIIIVLFSVVCCLCLLCACKSKEATVTYLASEGGNVYGELVQTVKVGDDCTQVFAVADAGYRFTGWSDGVDRSQRIDTEIEESKTITAQFEKIEYVKVNYIANEGGVVYGDINQKIELGEDCTQVYAVADAGYRFTGWNDGVTTLQRIDTGVEESKTITAQFEQILVLFYSDNLLVRKYALNEFKTIDITKIIGYASSKVFENWEFTSVYAGYNGDSPLNFIQTYLVTMKDLPDLTLHAIYSEMAEDKSIPFKSKTIAHALGGVDGKSYLNSKEAFNYWYGKGQRFFEADLSLTSDEQIVLDHTRGDYKFDDYMNSSAEGFTPMSLKDLVDYMEEYSEVWVDLDTIGFSNTSRFSSFVQGFKKAVVDVGQSVLDRIIVELTPYNIQLKKELENEIGISNFLYVDALAYKRFESV